MTALFSIDTVTQLVRSTLATSEEKGRAALLSHLEALWRDWQGPTPSTDDLADWHDHLGSNDDTVSARAALEQTWPAWDASHVWGWRAIERAMLAGAAHVARSLLGQPGAPNAEALTAHRSEQGLGLFDLALRGARPRHPAMIEWLVAQGVGLGSDSQAGVLAHTSGVLAQVVSQGAGFRRQDMSLLPWLQGNIRKERELRDFVDGLSLWRAELVRSPQSAWANGLRDVFPEIVAMVGQALAKAGRDEEMTKAAGALMGVTRRVGQALKMDPLYVQDERVSLAGHWARAGVQEAANINKGTTAVGTLWGRRFDLLGNLPGHGDPWLGCDEHGIPWRSWGLVRRCMHHNAPSSEPVSVMVGQGDAQAIWKGVASILRQLPERPVVWMALLALRPFAGDAWHDMAHDHLGRIQQHLLDCQRRETGSVTEVFFADHRGAAWNLIDQLVKAQQLHLDSRSEWTDAMRERAAVLLTLHAMNHDHFSVERAGRVLDGLRQAGGAVDAELLLRANACPAALGRRRVPDDSQAWQKFVLDAQMATTRPARASARI